MVARMLASATMNERARDGQDASGSPEDRQAQEPQGRASPYPISRLSGPISLVDAAREIERADQWIASTAGTKLELIAAQMQALRAQAEAVMREAQEHAALHRAEARFVRRPGQTYHLYEGKDGRRHWSMLSPDEWGGTPPSRFLGSFRLEADQSWTPVARVGERDRARAPVDDMLKGVLPRGD